MGIIGFVMLFATVFGGYVWAGGGFGIFLHPYEYVIIIGAGIAQMVIGTPVKHLKKIFIYGLKGLIIKDKGKKEFTEALQLMYDIFSAQKKEGIQAVEAHIEAPGESSIFQKYPSILSDHHATDFICDTMRTFVSGGPSPYDMDDLVTADLEVVHAEEHVIPSVLQNTADAFPAIGIVAAVLGIIITMGSISAGPEVVGMKVAGALVGTFLGIFIGYGFVGPIAKRVDAHFVIEGQFYAALKAGILANCRGLPPQVAVEFARRAVPMSERPSFKDLEEQLKGGGAAKAA